MDQVGRMPYHNQHFRVDVWNTKTMLEAVWVRERLRKGHFASPVKCRSDSEVRSGGVSSTEVPIEAIDCLESKIICQIIRGPSDSCRPLGV